MQPDEIGRAYDEITHLWTRPEFNRLNGIDQHTRALSFAKETGAALDVGCGCTGRFFELLLEAGYTPEGLDISVKKLALAKQRHPDLCFYQADICQWQPTRQYQFITAWDSIWHIPLSQQEPVIEKLIHALVPEGVLIFSCGGTEAPGEHTDDAMGPTVYYSSLGVDGFLKVLLALDCIVRHFEYDQYPELHSYFIVQKRSSSESSLALERCRSNGQ